MITTRVHRITIPVIGSSDQRLRGYVRTVHVAPARYEPDSIEIWYECADIDEVFAVRFWVYGTGHPITHPAPHVGTVLMGRFVWHVYAEYPLQESMS